MLMLMRSRVKKKLKQNWHVKFVLFALGDTRAQLRGVCIPDLFSLSAAFINALIFVAAAAILCF